MGWNARRAVTLAATLLVSVLGCSDDSSTGGGPGPAECARGTSYICQGRTGCSGRMYCQADGTLSECTCEPTAGSVAGTGASMAGMGGAGSGAMDAGADAGGMDAAVGMDAGSDAALGMDAGSDAGHDAGSDAGHDAGTDAGHDAGTADEDAGWDDAG